MEEESSVYFLRKMAEMPFLDNVTMDLPIFKYKVFLKNPKCISYVLVRSFKALKKLVKL